MEVESSVDNISALPADVICHILSFLPTKVAIQTSVLSTRWRHLHSFVSSLNFETNWDRRQTLAQKLNEFMNFVDRVLSFPGRPPVLSFRLACHQYVDPLRINGWLCALICGAIQELDLSFCLGKSEDPPLPASLFSCETLVVLKLKLGLMYPDLKIPARICLPNLKVLHIQDGGFLPDGSVERLLSSCPVLEDLVLRECCLKKGCTRFNISNENLKRLTIKSITDYNWPDFVQLAINAPRLVFLNYSFSIGQYLACADAQSLVALETLVLQRLPCLWGGITTQCSLEKSLICLLSNIKKIELFSFKERFEAEMDIVEFILNNAGVLEKLTIHIRQLSFEQQFKLMSDFLMLPRVSKRCRVMVIWVS